MRRLLFIILFGCASMLFAQQQDSPLVQAAKASGGKRKPTTKVITNADVKKSNGKLLVLPSKKESQAGAAAAPVDRRGPLEKQNDERRARDAADARVTKAQQKVDALQSELRRIEDSYYAENDPNYRDTTIVQRFAQTRNQLNGARKELADAVDAQDKLSDKQ